MADQIVIYTGGGTGTSGAGSTYHEGIGQGVADFLKPVADKFGYDVILVPSNGAVDNANKVGATSTTIALGIGQGGLEYDAVKKKVASASCAMTFPANVPWPLPQSRAFMTGVT